jgi:hypothetical protein
VNYESVWMRIGKNLTRVLSSIVKLAMQSHLFILR